jgi:two-component system nitrate/nitrite response regulator NarL
LYLGTRWLSQNFFSFEIFLLSDTPNEEEGLTFLKLGIVGYANTYISAERLTEAARIVSSGAVWQGQKVMQRLILDSYARAKEKEASNSGKILESLTNRERETANLIAQGQSNLEIAANLNRFGSVFIWYLSVF